MVRTVLAMLVRTGCENEFERAWRASAERIAHFPGNLGQSLSYDDTEPRRFVIASDWTSMDALHRFEQSYERVRLSETLDRLRESATKSVQKVVAVVAGCAEEERNSDEL